MKQSGLRLMQVLTALGTAALGAGLLTRAPMVAEGVSRGLSICGGTLIPSLFPFMTLAGFLSVTGYGRILSAPLRFLTVKAYRLPGDLGAVILLSMIGGYPVGARMIASLLEQGRIDERTAERMLCFCVNPGPSFLITAVGAGMFRDRTAGLILFASQTAATLLVGFASSFGAPRPRLSRTAFTPMKPAAALVAAVAGAVNGMLTVCAFTILFSGLLPLLVPSGLTGFLAGVLSLDKALLEAAARGFFEVTSGCAAAAGAGGVFSFGVVSAILSFGGLSVLFQVMACFRDHTLRFRPLILSRLAHMGVSTATAVPLYRFLCRPLPVWASADPPMAQTDGGTVLISVCLLAMCSIFLLKTENTSR